MPPPQEPNPENCPISPTPLIDPSTRFVLYNENRGIFLGENKWTAVNAGHDNGAMTYDESWANYYIQWFKEHEGIEVQKFEVETDMDFNLVSPAGLERQGLPTWVPEPPPALGRRRRN